MKQTQSPLEVYREDIENMVVAGYSAAQISTKLQTKVPTSERSIRRALRRWGMTTGEGEQPGTKVNGDDAEIVTKPDPRQWSEDLNDTEALLQERGLSPDDWEVHNVIVNEWDSPTGETLKQLKVHLKRKKPFIMVEPARVKIDLPAPKAYIAKHSRPKLVVLVGDQQAPYHDRHLHKLFCEWLREAKPDEGVCLGDTIDLGNISRHPDDPDWPGTTQECLDAGGQILYDYRTSNTATVWTKLPGNHDERLRRAVIDRLGDWYGLRPAQVETLPEHPPIHDPVHLLRLDELGIKYVRPQGSYDHAQVTLSPYLAARHGWIARKGSGTSALATLEHLGHSVVVGHTHRLGQVFRTKHNINGTQTTLTAVEAGCMCRIENGLGYAVAPDWQNGFATATIHQDGTFHLELANYLDGKLYWRGQRYS